MRAVAEARGTSVARVALAWLLAQPHVTSVIIGAKNEQQLADNPAATELALTPDELAKLAKLAKLDTISALPSEYPGWMLAFQNRDKRA